MTRKSLLATLPIVFAFPSQLAAKGPRMIVPQALFALQTQRHRIASLHVRHVDDLTQTQTPITRSSLEAWPSAFRHEAHDRATIDSALHVIEESMPVPTSESFEVRWKISFVASDGAALLTAFHHSHEPYGYVNATRVHFANDGLLTFLRHTFGAHEKTLDRL